jgi:hypothetical protein
VGGIENVAKNRTRTGVGEARADASDQRAAAAVRLSHPQNSVEQPEPACPAWAVCQEDGTAQALKGDVEFAYGRPRAKCPLDPNQPDPGKRDLADGRIVPVRLRAEFSAELRDRAPKRFQEFYPPTAIPNSPADFPGVLEQIQDDVPELALPEGWTERGFTITCVLGLDWKPILESARRCQNQRPGLKYSSPAAYLAAIIYDLEDALDALDPGLDWAGRVAFWTSADVRRHIREFCHKLIQRGNDAAVVWRSERMVLEQLGAYAHSLGPGIPLAQGSPTSAVPKRRRGPKPEDEKRQRIVEILAGTSWNENLGQTCQRLDEAEVPISRSWQKKQHWESWADANDENPDSVKRCIRRHLKLGRRAPSEPAK